MKFIDGDIHWGIIGVGDVCEVKSGPAFSKIPHSTLSAIMRRDEEKVKDYAYRHKVNRYYTDAQELIDDPEINAIYIATPPAYHEEYAIKAMAAGKPVYIEKPIAMNAASCERMIEASAKYKVAVTGAYYRRELPLFKKIKALIDENAIGKIRVVAIRTLQSPSKNVISKSDNWRTNPSLSGGGLFHDLAPHQLDLMYYFLGTPNSISGQSLNQGKEYNAPDVTTLEAVFQNDILLQGLWAFNVHESAVEDSCTIIGENGTLTFSFFKGADLFVHIADKKELITFNNPIHIQQPMIEQTINYFRGLGNNPCSLEDALVSMKMIDAVT
jgi:predicted dehydrogenase